MNTEVNVKSDEQAAVDETPEEKIEGGLKVKTNVMAGPEIQVEGGG